MKHAFFNPVAHAPSTPPPSLVFSPLLKISLGNPYLKILDLTKLIADAPIKKSVNLISDHFEIWVQKPPMDERVKKIEI